MKQNASSWAAVSLIAMVGFGVGLNQWRRAGEMEAMRAEIERQRVAAQDELRRWEKRATSAQPSYQAEQPGPGARGPAKNSAPMMETKPEPSPTIAERLQRDPVFQQRTLAVDRAHLLATYGALFRKLGLSPEKIGQFQEIAFKRTERDMDLQAVVEMKHLTPEDPAIKKMQQAGDDEFAAAQRALLGGDGFKSFQDYERTTILREMVAGWAGGAVVEIHEPFTARQGEELVQIMANASSNYRRGNDATTDEPGYWAAVEVEARKILSPAQFQLFTTMEPPLPMGARFQSRLYEKVQEVLDAEKRPATGMKPSGG